MNLIDLERDFIKEVNLDGQIKTTTKDIRSLLNDYNNNFLSESISDLPLGLTFDKLVIQYRETYLLLNKSNGSGLSYRLVFVLVDPVQDEELFAYEIEFNSNGEYLDDFFLNL